MPGSEGRDHVQGSADARVTLVEYGDYECPYSGKAYPIVKDVQERMGEQLRLMFPHFVAEVLLQGREVGGEGASPGGA